MPTDVLILTAFTALIGLYCGCLIHSSIRESNAKQRQAQKRDDDLEAIAKMIREDKEARRESIEADHLEDLNAEAQSHEYPYK
jgi:hypothetical protein